MARPHRPRVATWLAGIAALTLTAATGAWFGSRAQSPAQAAARAAAPRPSWITAKVERRVLSSTLVLRGEVRPRATLTVQAPTSVEGTAVITGIPVATGQQVAEGTKLIEVSGRPVFLLQGDVPIYRSLRPGMAGADVAQLQAALTRLGLQPDVDGTFGEATKTAVEAFYADAGYQPVPASATGVADVAAAKRAYDDALAAAASAEAAYVRAGQGATGSTLAAAQAAVNQATRARDDARAEAADAQRAARAALDAAMVTRDELAVDPDAVASDIDQARLAALDAQTAYDATVRRGDSAIAAANEQLWIAALALNEATNPSARDDERLARDTAVAARDAAALDYLHAVSTNGPTVALGEVVFSPTTPARVQSTVRVLGDVEASGTQEGSGLVVLAAGELEISSSVDLDGQELVRAGMPVELLDEATDETFTGSIVTVSASSTVDAEGRRGAAVTVVPSHALPSRLAGSNLRITVTAASTDGEVMVVPLAAVSSDASGETRVSVVDDSSAEPIDVAVSAGLSADGFVAVEPVEPAALTAGDRVVVGR